LADSRQEEQERPKQGISFLYRGRISFDSLLPFLCGHKPIVWHVWLCDWDRRKVPAAKIGIRRDGLGERRFPASGAQESNRILQGSDPGCAGFDLHFNPLPRVRRRQRQALDDVESKPTV